MQESASVRVGLHLSVQTRPGQSSESAIETALEDVVLADEMGLSSALFAEHHFIEDGWVTQPLTMASAAATVTKQIRVGSNILILPLQHPVMVAERAVMVDILSKGRCVLGAGVGWRIEDFRGFGISFEDRYRTFAEGLKAVRALMRGENVNMEGTTYTCTDARLRLLPEKLDGIPLWVGATGPQGIRRAAALADAWILSPQVRVSKLVEGRQQFVEARIAAGQNPIVEVPIRREAFVAETDKEAWKLFSNGIRHQYGDVYASRHPDFPQSGGERELREWAAGLMVVGSVETVAKEFLELQEQLGVTEVLVRSQLPGVEPSAARRSLELFGEVSKVLQTGHPE